MSWLLRGAPWVAQGMPSLRDVCDTVGSSTGVLLRVPPRQMSLTMSLPLSLPTATTEIFQMRVLCVVFCGTVVPKLP